jgi:predicted phosphate transport protein (TIGR00153 family)
MRVLMPKETKFYDMFAELAETVTAGATLLHVTLSSFENLEVSVQKMKKLEHAADDIAHAIFTRLNTTFVTPFDREDIHRLAASMDDVLDLAYGAGERLVLYDVPTATSAAVELASILVRQCEQISHAIAALDRHDDVIRYCVEINRLENEADRVARGAIANLFACERDPIALIKFKELYEVLEDATDKAEDVANVLEQIVLKSA